MHSPALGLYLIICLCLHYIAQLLHGRGLLSRLYTQATNATVLL